MKRWKGKQKQTVKEREREKTKDAAQLIWSVAKTYSKVTKLMRLFRVQLRLEYPYNKTFKRVLWNKSFILISAFPVLWHVCCFNMPKFKPNKNTNFQKLCALNSKNAKIGPSPFYNLTVPSDMFHINLNEILHSQYINLTKDISNFQCVS